MSPPTADLPHASIGTGIYTTSEAARLLRVSTQKLTRWAQGYVFKRDGRPRASGPVIDRSDAEPGLLNFYDLIELFFVREFRKANVPLPDIRRDAAILREKWVTPYPFALRRIAELGQTLIDPGEMQTVWGNQRVMEFAREFFKDVDFAESGLAEAWHPLGKQKLVVLTPSRSFGAPIEVRSGIRTETLYRQYVAEGNIEAVAEWYEVSAEGVEQAVEFEEKWRARAA
jgi:uncharacterized protein (DUF433 family)